MVFGEVMYEVGFVEWIVWVLFGFYVDCFDYLVCVDVVEVVCW